MEHAISDGIEWTEASKGRTYTPIAEFRWISTLGRIEQGVKALQQADKCLEDGSVKWRTIGLHLVSNEEFNEAVRI